MAAGSSENRSADRIREALDADLARILTLHAEGKALSARDRKVLEQELARQAKEEREERAGSEGNAGRELQLESDLTGRLDFRTSGEAGEAYGYSVRQVKNWKKEGRLRNMPCPLEEPARMPAWFEAVYAPRECPQRLRDAVQKLLTEGLVAAAAPEKQPSRPVIMPVVGDHEVGFEATLQRARRREAFLDKRLQQALLDGDPRADALETQWGKAASRVRELEKAAPAILEAQGVYLRREDVRRELVAIAGNMPKAARVILRKHRRALQQAAETEDWETAVGKVVDDIFGEMCRTEFAEPLELQEAS